MPTRRGRAEPRTARGPELPGARAEASALRKADHYPALDRLQALRDPLKKSLIVRSAYRSPEHNRAVGGATRSKHMEGAAFDIAMANQDPVAFEAAAREVGFLGFGFCPRSGLIHVDLGPARQWGERFPVQATAFAAEARPAREVLAAQNIGLQRVPVIELAHLSETQERAYILADKRLAEQAGWHRQLLGLELGDLGVDLGNLGFEGAELDALLGLGNGDPREEETPESPADPVSRRGDFWQLGPHRLLCSDFASAAEVARLVDGVKPHLTVTDPPYGVACDPAWHNQAGASKTKRTGTVMNDDRADLREAWALLPGNVAYVWHGALHAKTVAEARPCGSTMQMAVCFMEIGQATPFGAPP